MGVCGVEFHEEQILNSRGMHLNTCRWLPGPNDKEVKGLVFLCHGYGMECPIYTGDTAQRLASAGYGVYGIDYEGHGKSEGLQGFIPSFQTLVTDCVTFFNAVMDRKAYAGKPRFLLGESLGGAVSIMIIQRDPARWNGLILVAPMLRISKKVKPPPLVVGLLIYLSNIIPTWKLVPPRQLIEKSHKDPRKLERIRSNPYAYRGLHRVKTAVGLLQTSWFIEQHMAELSSPFICVQGTEDSVNEPEASQKLFDSAVSFDKTLKLYPGMWHGLTTGEPDENVDLVFEDIIGWLNKRSEAEFKRPTR